MRERQVRIDRSAEDDDPVGRAARSVPSREALLQRIEQEGPKRRKSGDHEQYERSDHQLAAKRPESRRQQDRAEHAQADQDIHRQQHDAERFGEYKKQEGNLPRMRAPHWTPHPVSYADLTRVSIRL